MAFFKLHFYLFDLQINGTIKLTDITSITYKDVSKTLNQFSIKYHQIPNQHFHPEGCEDGCSTDCNVIEFD
jgi:hypothetical protein